MEEDHTVAMGPRGGQSTDGISQYISLWLDAVFGRQRVNVVILTLAATSLDNAFRA
jgi:hypothetical protein